MPRLARAIAALRAKASPTAAAGDAPAASPRREFVPTGHYYSAVPSAEHLARHRTRIIGARPDVPGVDLNLDAQRDLLAELEPLADDAPFADEPRAGLRYRYDNEMFGHVDGLFLHLLLRYLRPRRFVEVGSGWSSACALDTADAFLDGDVSFTFVEPHGERLSRVLRPGDEERVEILREEVQDVGLDVFSELRAGDVLFVDSTHTVKAGGDVNHLVFDVLPTLRPGVVVHVHDVFPGFEYPWAWLEEGRAWTEAYLLRAFLAFNTAFEILLWPCLLGRQDPEAFTTRFFGRSIRNLGGSIYIRRR